jgi:putative tricarboxylic transport membrane protein
VAVNTLRRADIAVGCFVALFGLFILVASISISGGVAARLPPRTFPVVIGCLLLVCGVALALKSWTLKDEGPRVHWPDKMGFRTILVTLISLACYIAMTNPLGMPLATGLYISFSIWYLKPSRWWMALTIGVISGVVTYWLFIRLLGLSFPEGVIFGG